jgi:hypothetical protein
MILPALSSLASPASPDNASLTVLPDSFLTPARGERGFSRRPPHSMRRFRSSEVLPSLHVTEVAPLEANIDSFPPEMRPFIVHSMESQAMQIYFGASSGGLPIDQVDEIYRALRHYLDVAISLNLISVACKLWGVLTALSDDYGLRTGRAASDRAFAPPIDKVFTQFSEREHELVGSRSAALKDLENEYLTLGVPLITAHRRHQSGHVIRPRPILKPELRETGSPSLTWYRKQKERILQEYDQQKRMLEAARDSAVAPLFRRLVGDA